jgi:hypothetical protein
MKVYKCVKRNFIEVFVACDLAYRLHCDVGLEITNNVNSDNRVLGKFNTLCLNWLENLY